MLGRYTSDRAARACVPLHRVRVPHSEGPAYMYMYTHTLIQAADGGVGGLTFNWRHALLATPKRGIWNFPLLGDDIRHLPHCWHMEPGTPLLPSRPLRSC